jgi:hypothetical protein
MTAWTDLVQKIYKEKSGKNASYKLKHAMKDAAKVYKKHSKTAKKIRGGHKECKDGSIAEIDKECPKDDEAKTEPEVVVITEKEGEAAKEAAAEAKAEAAAAAATATATGTKTGGKRKTKKSKKDKKRKSAKK